MKRLFERMRRIAAAALSAALLWGVLLPATPVRAEDAPAPQAVNDAGQELILLHKHETGQNDMPYVTDTLRDGDTIPALKLSFGEITLCRGDADHPLTQSETNVQLYLGDTLVPEDAVKFVPLHDTYAQYGVQVNTSGVLTQLLAQASPDFGMTLKLTAGEESLSITIPNAGVTVEGPTNLPLTIQAAGPDLYAASVYLNVTSDALRYIQPNMDWIAADMQLTGGTDTPSKEEAATKIPCHFERKPDGCIYTITLPFRYIAPMKLAEGTHAGFAISLIDFDLENGREREKRLSLTESGLPNERMEAWASIVLMKSKHPHSVK